MPSYSQITDEFFAVNNELIAQVFKKFQRSEEALSNLTMETYAGERVRRNSEISELVRSNLQPALVSILPESTVWFKDQAQPKASPYLWIVSPFESHLMGQTFSSVALAKGEELVIGVFSNFSQGEVVSGVLGEGTSSDDETFRVATGELCETSRFMQFVLPPATEQGEYASVVAPLLRRHRFANQVNRVPENLGFYLTLVARGALDLVIATGFHFHDLAAAVCAAEQAGARVSDFQGGKAALYSGRSLVCGNPKIHRQVVGPGADGA